MSARHRRRAVTEASKPGEWTAYFDGIDASRRLLATVVPAGREGAHRNAGVAHRLHGIEYDARADAIAIDVGGPDGDTPFLRYFVAAPRSIVIERLAEATTIEIVDARNERTHVYVYPESVTLAPEAARTTTSERDEAAE